MFWRILWSFFVGPGTWGRNSTLAMLAIGMLVSLLAGVVFWSISAVLWGVAITVAAVVVINLLLCLAGLMKGW